MKFVTLFVLLASFYIGSAQVNVGLADGTAANAGQPALLVQLKPQATFNTQQTFQWDNAVITLEYDGALPEPSASTFGAVSNINCFSWASFYQTSSFCGDGLHRVVLFFSGNTNCTMMTGSVIDEIVLPVVGIPLSAFTLVSDNGACTQPAAINNASSGNEFGIFDPASINVPLPVEYISLEVARANQTSDATVAWTIANQIDVDYYEIMRGDGIQYTSIGRVNANEEFSDTAIGEYDFLDSGEQRSTQYYYIRHTDLDGQRDSSWIESLESSSQSEISLFPNPSNGLFTLNGLDAFNAQISALHVYANDGKLVYHKSLESQNVSQLELDLSFLPSGGYSLVFFDVANRKLDYSSNIIVE